MNYTEEQIQDLRKQARQLEEMRRTDGWPILMNLLTDECKKLSGILEYTEDMGIVAKAQAQLKAFRRIDEISLSVKAELETIEQP